MSRWIFSGRFYLPGYANQNDFTNVSRRLLDVGDKQEGMGAADSLYAYEAGDVPVELDDEDRYFSTIFGNTTVTRLDKRFELDILRRRPSDHAFVRFFRGFVHLETIRLDRLRRRLSCTLLGGMRLLDWYDADTKLRRPFPALTVAAAITAGANSVQVSISAPTHLIVQGDKIAFLLPGQDASQSLTEYLVRGTRNNFIDFEPSLPAGTTIPVSATVLCRTPFPRNVAIKEIVETVLTGAGMPSPNRDVRFTGTFIKSSRPFTSGINTSGVNLYGELRGLVNAPEFAGPTRQLFAAHAPGRFDAGLLGYILGATAETQTSGFVESGQESGGLWRGGGYFDRVDLGEAAPGSEGSINVDYFIGMMNYRKIRGTAAAATTHPCQVSRWAKFSHSGANGVMLELRYEETVRSDEFPDPSLLVDVELGGGPWTLRLYRWTTTNHGKNWTEDTGAFRRALITSVVTNGGSQGITYTYRIRPIYSWDTRRGGFENSVDFTTVNGRNAANQTVNFVSVDGAVAYEIIRVASGATGSSATIGRIGTVEVGSVGVDEQDIFGNSYAFTDTGQTATSVSLAAGFYQISSGNNQTDTPSTKAPGIEFGFSLDCVDGATSPLNITVFASVYVGGGAKSTANFLAKLRMDGSGSFIDYLFPLNYSCGGAKTIMTLSGAGAPIDVYVVDVNLGVLLNERVTTSHGPKDAATPVASLPLGENIPLLETIRWDRSLDFSPPPGSVRRISMAWLAPTQVPSKFNLNVGFFSVGGDASTGLKLRESALIDEAFVRTEKVIARVNEYDLDDVKCTWWLVNIGGVSDVWVFVIVEAGRWHIVSRFHSGLIEYADAEGMSGSKFCQEVGFPVNAVTRVGNTTAGDPFGIFLSRDLVPTNAPSIRDLTTVSGRRSLLKMVDLRQYRHTYSMVRVIGKDDAGNDLIVEASSLKNLDLSSDFQERDRLLEVECRHIRTRSLASAVAEALLDHYSPRDSSGNVLPPRTGVQVEIFDDGEGLWLPQSQLRIVDFQGITREMFVDRVRIKASEWHVELEGVAV